MNLMKLKGHSSMLGANVMWGLMSPVAKFVSGESNGVSSFIDESFLNESFDDCSGIRLSDTPSGELFPYVGYTVFR